MKPQVETKKAFTIVELTIALAFISVLLVAVASVVIQVTGIYQKGLSIRAVNTTGREIISDLKRVVGGSPIVEQINPVASNSRDITNDDILKARSAYFNSTEMSVGTGTSKIQAGGVFCTGSYTYVWNTAETLKNYRNTNKTDNAYTINGAVYKFARVSDFDRKGCEHNSDQPYSLKTTHLTYTGVSSDSIVELINNDESDLAVYDFSVMPAVQNTITGQVFYSGSFVLATIRGGINILSNGDYCTSKTDGTVYDTDGNDGQSEFKKDDLNYCAINKFNFAMRATGESTTVDQYGER